MTDAAESDRCPYCGARHVGALRSETDYYRCHGCNFYVRADWLVDDPDDYVLNADRDVLCPWCGYPAAIMQPIPGESEFVCEGCAGTLIKDMLVSQMALLVDRRKGGRERNLLLIMVVLLIFFFLVVGMVL